MADSTSVLPRRVPGDIVPSFPAAKSIADQFPSSDAGAYVGVLSEIDGGDQSRCYLVLCVCKPRIFHQMNQCRAQVRRG
jgi:hypothetical protein